MQLRPNSYLFLIIWVLACIIFGLIIYACIVHGLIWWLLGGVAVVFGITIAILFSNVGKGVKK